MNNQWMATLQQSGAVLEGNRIVHFGDPKQEAQSTLDGNIVAPLNYALLSASGADTETYLQGQLTNDVRMVSDGQSQLGAHCTPKGRMMALFRLFRHGDDYLLRLPEELKEAMHKRLSMFIMRSQVTITDRSDELAGLGVAGPRVEEVLGGLVDSLPSEIDETSFSNNLTIIRVSGDRPRFEVYGDADSLGALWSRLKETLVPVGTSQWHWLDIRAGLPTVVKATSEAFVPQMTNLQLVNGVNFRKGCYTGQEVVARMQYLGKLKRRMYLAHVDGDNVPLAGTELWAADSSSGQGTGKVVSAEQNPAGGVDLLAVLEIAAHDGGQVRLNDEKGMALQFLELPYPFETEDSADNS